MAGETTKSNGIENFFDKERKLNNIAAMFNIPKSEVDNLSDEEKEKILNNVEYNEF